VLKRVELSDDLLMSTAARAIAALSKAFPAAAEQLHSGKYGESSVWIAFGRFDVDFEDESGSASLTY
jgi:hypothetical protein